MKKLSLIVFIPIIVGVILLIVGSYTKNESVSSAGTLVLSAGTFVTMFVLVVVCLVLAMTGKLQDGKSDKKKGSRKRGGEHIDADENESLGREAEIADFSKRAGKRYKNSTNKEKIFGWLFFGFLMTDFFLIPVFAFFKIYIGTIVCFCLFVGTLLISLLVTVILQNCPTKSRVRKLDKMNLLCGYVKECLLLDAGDSGIAKRNSTTKKLKENYKVIVFADGKDYTAYSESYQKKDEVVVISVEKGGSATIVDLEKQKDEVDKIKAKLDIDQE